MQIELNEIKEYLKAEDEPDTIINTIKDAAISFCETKLRRPILDSNMNDENRWTVPEEIRIAVYLLASQWHENRIPIGQVTEEIAFTVNAILGPHRFRNV